MKADKLRELFSKIDTDPEMDLRIKARILSQAAENGKPVKESGYGNTEENYKRYYGNRISMARVLASVVMSVLVITLSAVLLYGLKEAIEYFDDPWKKQAGSDHTVNLPSAEDSVIVPGSNDSADNEPVDNDPSHNETDGNVPEPSEPDKGSETGDTGNRPEPAKSLEGQETKPGDEPKTVAETGEKPENREGTPPEKEPDNAPDVPAVTGPFYLAYFDVISDTKVKTSIPYLVVRLHGKVNTINPSDLTDIILTRNGEAVDNNLKYTGEYRAFTWGYEDVTDFYFEFEHNNVEPGRYALSGKYQGTPFTVTDKIIEGAVSDAPANAEDLLFASFVHMRDENGNPIYLSELAFYFRGRQDSFYQSDLTELKCLLNGEEIPLEFKNDVIRYYEVDETDYTQFHLILKDRLTSPGRYTVTGKYRGVSFKSIGIVIP